MQLNLVTPTETCDKAVMYGVQLYNWLSLKSTFTTSAEKKFTIINEYFRIRKMSDIREYSLNIHFTWWVFTNMKKSIYEYSIYV